MIILAYHDHFSNALYHFILPLLFICVTHLLIDRLKLGLLDQLKPLEHVNLKRLGFFSLDQCFHITIILLTSLIFFDLKGSAMLNSASRLFKENDGFELGPLNVFLLLLIVFILATSVSGHIIKLLVGSLPSELANFEGEITFKNKLLEAKNSNEVKMENDFTEKYHYFTYSKPNLSRGMLIGYIERLLVILLIVVDAYSSIAFIIAAKSIARFKQLEDRNWAEYFLLGTLASIFLGLVFGLFLKKMLI